MKPLRLVILFLVPVLASHSAHAEVRVVASIKPIHALVSAVMKGAGRPVLLMDGNSSPHNHAMRPSQAAALAQAELIFWVGHSLETFLEKPLGTIGGNARSVELLEVEGLSQIELEDGHDDHNHGFHDPHIWLDPNNAKMLVAEILAELIAADPEQADLYKNNALAYDAVLDRLISEIRATVASVSKQNYLVFHDAYRHFEHRFGLQNGGVIALQPQTAIGAARLRELRKTVNSNDVVCVFSEPQFSPRIVRVITEDTDARIGSLDPLGQSIDAGPEHYGKLMRNLAQSVRMCLADRS